MAITEVNIATAALMAQFVLLAMVFVAALVVQASGPSALAELPWIIFAIALITVGALLFSDQLSSLWRPLFGAANFGGFTLAGSMLVTFVANIALVLILVSYTGGSRSSPFTPVYFLLPVLAIFLRESFGRVVGYSIAVAVLFTANLTYEDRYEIVRGSRIAYWFVSITAFALATVIGLITRPR